jgi:transcriptional regulator with XRE-family HTH domain
MTYVLHRYIMQFVCDPSMVSVDFVDSVIARMAAHGVSQSALARECGLSQPHLSRVLNKRLKLRAKTRSRLEHWMAGSSVGGPMQEGSVPTVQDLQQAVLRLGAKAPERRMQIMQMLKAIEAIISKS